MKLTPEDWERFGNGMTIGAWLTNEELAEMGPWPWIIMLAVCVTFLVAVFW